MPGVRSLRKQGVPLAALYDRVASGWSATVMRLGYPAAYHALLAPRVPVRARSVLDVGAGTGAFAEAYLDCAGASGVPDQLTLLDPSGQMLDEATARLSARSARLAAVVAPAGGDSLHAERFDVALCAHVLEHLDDPDGVLGWIRDRLAPGGTLFLVVSRPHWCTALLRWQWGHRAFHPDDMLDRLTRAGFIDVHAIRFPLGPPSRTSMGYVARRH